MLVFAHRLGIDRARALHAWPRRCALAFEAERQYAASIHVVEGEVGRSPVAFVKGAPERVVQMCATTAARDGDLAIDRGAALAVARRLAERGTRVLAVAAGPVGMGVITGDVVDPAGLVDLTLLGFVGMIDPLRPEAKDAVVACRRAGIEVAMVTGDHPVTALTIAKELGIAPPAETIDHVVTGAMLRAAVAQDGASSTENIDTLVKGRTVFARIEPEQKLAIVESLQRAGHFVAVTGDGANDAPALRAGHIGVAMGARGTDVAKETAGLIITDDNFASIVAGVEEGRVAYDNVRKVIFLAISTGVAEILIFALAVTFGTPLPLLPIQLLWMNLVTNGIQDVGLAFEPREREVLRDPPRRTDEAIFDRVMVQRVLVSATIMCAVSFAWFKFLLDRGVPLELARNQLLLLMVLFENIHAGNCRSEHRSLFTHSPLRNPVLFVGTVFVQGLHLVAMHVPVLADTLGLAPVSLQDWLTCLGLSLTLLVAMELEKLWRRMRTPPRT
jgi:magnesium-transporting ATPase (P-type)